MKSDIVIDCPQHCSISHSGLNNHPVLGVMRQTAAAFEMRGLVYWWSAGTALGLKREKDKYIKYDSDVDVEILVYDDFNEKEFTDFMKKRGYCNYRRMRHKDDVMQLAFSKSEVPVDVYFYYETDGKYYINYNNHGILRIPKEFVDNREEYRDFICPNPLTKYLSWRFGRNWNIPTGKKVPWQETAGEALLKWSRV